jgi:hypothetical protein
MVAHKRFSHTQSEQGQIDCRSALLAEAQAAAINGDFAAKGNSARHGKVDSDETRQIHDNALGC